ncbi:hypothetical protein QBC32DRAFT_66156 [Pseudoneurospora amorphoporcata]|uniref:Uncharacterized protein n=1 Tax=Pseudoneurospora amorphoporcata TaxID=241081 RepID=A0AAN6SCP5_9PEZI|nr:hypothetical protein QBC32DRAFT_66156 [Pseudoneurospora amorphoporcata]
MGHEVFGRHSFTNSSDPNWVPEPGIRGTFSILSMCLVTLGLAAMGGMAVEMNDDDRQTDSTDRIRNFFPV